MHVCGPSKMWMMSSLVFSCQVHAMALLNADFICGVCERAYSNSAAFHLHLLGNEHQLKLSHPKSRQGRHTVSVS